MTHLCAVKMHSTTDQSMRWLCVQMGQCSRFLYFCLVRRFYIFVSSTLISGRVKCDGYRTILFRTDCVREWRRWALLTGNATDPWTLPTHHFSRASLFCASLLPRLSDTSENQPTIERLDSDNQINLSRLIGTLARDPVRRNVDPLFCGSPFPEHSTCG